MDGAQRDVGLIQRKTGKVKERGKEEIVFAVSWKGRIRGERKRVEGTLLVNAPGIY